MFNQPTIQTKRYSIGPGILLIGPSGATPTIQVGSVKGNATITLNRTLVEIRQGSPQALVFELSSKEDAMLELTGIEWNFDNFALALSDGITSVSGVDEVLDLGGRSRSTPLALRFLHTTQDGSTIDFRMWKAFGDGKIAIGIHAEDVHEFPYKFMAADGGDTDWGGNSLTNGKKLVQIRRTPAV